MRAALAAARLPRRRRPGDRGLPRRSSCTGPLFLEGEAGVGKTEVGRTLARLLDAPLIRLQCYEGIDASQALYDWDFPRQLLHLRRSRRPAALGDAERPGGRALRPPLPAGPAAAGRAGDHAVGAAGRRGRPRRRRVRGVPAGGARRLHRHGPRARHGARRRRRRSSSSPPTAPARSTTRSSAAASTTGSTTPTSTARCAIVRVPRARGDGGADRAGRRRGPRAARPGPVQAARRRRDHRLDARRWSRSAPTRWTPSVATATLGAVLKYREDTERATRLDVGALIARAVAAGERGGDRREQHDPPRCAGLTAGARCGAAGGGPRRQRGRVLPHAAGGGQSGHVRAGAALRGVARRAGARRSRQRLLGGAADALRRSRRPAPLRPGLRRVLRWGGATPAPRAGAGAGAAGMPA